MRRSARPLDTMQPQLHTGTLSWPTLALLLCLCLVCYSLAGPPAPELLASAPAAPAPLYLPLAMVRTATSGLPPAATAPASPIPSVTGTPTSIPTPEATYTATATNTATVEPTVTPEPTPDNIFFVDVGDRAFVGLPDSRHDVLIASEAQNLEGVFLYGDYVATKNTDGSYDFWFRKDLDPTCCSNLPNYDAEQHGELPALVSRHVGGKGFYADAGTNDLDIQSGFDSSIIADLTSESMRVEGSVNVTQGSGRETALGYMHLQNLHQIGSLTSGRLFIAHQNEQWVIKSGNENSFRHEGFPVVREGTTINPEPLRFRLFINSGGAVSLEYLDSNGVWQNSNYQGNYNLESNKHNVSIAANRNTRTEADVQVTLTGEPNQMLPAHPTDTVWGRSETHNQSEIPREYETVGLKTRAASLGMEIDIEGQSWLPSDIHVGSIQSTKIVGKIGSLDYSANIAAYYPNRGQFMGRESYRDQFIEHNIDGYFPLRSPGAEGIMRWPDYMDFVNEQLALLPADMPVVIAGFWNDPGELAVTASQLYELLSAIQQHGNELALNVSNIPFNTEQKRRHPMQELLEDLQYLQDRRSQIIAEAEKNPTPQNLASAEAAASFDPSRVLIKMNYNPENYDIGDPDLFLKTSEAILQLREYGSVMLSRIQGVDREQEEALEWFAQATLLARLTQSHMGFTEFDYYPFRTEAGKKGNFNFSLLTPELIYIPDGRGGEMVFRTGYCFYSDGWYAVDKVLQMQPEELVNKLLQSTSVDQLRQFREQNPQAWRQLIAITPELETAIDRVRPLPQHVLGSW